MHVAEQKAIGKPIPDDLELPAMTRILQNMVGANDLDGVTEILTKMQGHEKSDGFTIQDVAGNGLLQIAALKNFDKMTELLLNKGFDINYVDDNHGTALQAAIYMDSGQVMKVLLDRSRTPPIKVDTVGGYYGCALQVAAFKGSSEYITQLVDRGATEDIYIAKSKYGTALQAAARTGLPLILMQILALKPTQINREGGAWGTALQAAAKGDYSEATAKLRQLSRGRVLSQANEVDRKKGAEKTDYLRVAEILLEKGAKVNVKPSGRLQTPINAAASSGQYKMLKLLLDNDDVSQTETEKKQTYGRALLSAITQIFEKDNRKPLVAELVTRGADVNFLAGNCLHNRPLAAAAAMNDEKVVEYLLEISKENKQEFLDAESGIYGSALRAALSAPQPAKATALQLINAGADTRNGDEKYGNVLHLAAFSNLPEVVSILLDQCKLDVNVLDKNYQTALHIAAYRGYEQVVEILLLKKADANLKDVWGNIPLDIVGSVIARESHPVPSLQGLRQIREMLLKKSVCKNDQQICGPFPGPLVAQRPQPPRPEGQKAKPVFELPKWNPGLKFYAKIVDFLQKDEQEHVLVKDLAIDDLLYKTEPIKETMDDLEVGYARKLRWIHLPTNNVCHNLHSIQRIH
jgi:ankyrin repeat protein